MFNQDIEVLLVEDQPDHAALVEALVREGLRDSKVVIQHVTNGADALERLENNSFNLCLLDYQLADEMTGLTVLDAVREKGIKTPVIMLTAMGDEDLAVQAMKSGAKDYIRKDALSPELLRSTMRHALALHAEEMLRKHTQDELRQAKDELEGRVLDLDEANEELVRLGRMRDEFISSISHELRTPIANLKLCQQLLSAHPEGRDRYLLTLRRETDRLHFIIEELLSVARMAVEPPILNLELLDLNSLVLLHVADRTLLAQEHGLELTFSEENDLPKVHADRVQIERVLGILLINALNYTPEGGHVAVSTLLRKVKKSRQIGFRVSDTGPGIPPEERERLFEHFFRGKVALEQGVPGTGLGLAIAREIVEQHGGTIDMESDGVPGKGTTFTVWLPLNGKSSG